MEENTYKPDAHSQDLLSQYRENLPVFKQMTEGLASKLKELLSGAGIMTAAVESRVKTEASLAGKLEKKGGKYAGIFDITDIIGLRIITFYSDDVDKVASMMERYFEIDWANSVDKRKAHETDSFGYLSLHYICRIPEKLYNNPEYKIINKIRFEVQMRTLLQHAWANMNHDTGYKSGVEVPSSYMRQLSRLAGILELVDDEFSRLRTEINDYRRNVQALVASGNLSEVPLDGDTFRSYLEIKPFDKLNHRIAAINQAEIMEVPLMNFLTMFKAFQCKTLGDVDKIRKDLSEASYQIARYQIGLSDIDIISSSIGPQNICLAHILLSGAGKFGVKFMLDTLNGPSESNEQMAEFLVEQAKDLPFMNQQKQ
ncbi:MAG: hypothetical protein IJ795_03640 [Bacteroidales bacterium]|nr:hypothetical protein [Bacteroidales bacterium]